MADGEVGVGNEQTAVSVLDIADDELVSAVRQLVDNGVTIASVESPDEFPLFCGLQRVIYMECQQRFLVCLFDTEWCERREQADAVAFRWRKANADHMAGNTIEIALTIHLLGHSCQQTGI